MSMNGLPPLPTDPLPRPRFFWPTTLSLQSFLRAQRRALLSGKFLAGLISAAVLGGLLCAGLIQILPPMPQPIPVFVASFVIDMFGLGALLVLLPLAEDASNEWRITSAWLSSILLAASTYAGVGIVWRNESVYTYFVLLMLFAAQAAALCAVYGLLLTLLRPARYLAKQTLGMLLGLLVTALLWSQGPIQAATVTTASSTKNLAAILAEGTLALSPPAAVGSAWYRESDAARDENKRFDLIRCPVTYDLWIGSAGITVAYPDVMPGKSASKGITYGLIVTMLIWGLPLMLLSDFFILFCVSDKSLTIKNHG